MSTLATSGEPWLFARSAPKKRVASSPGSWNLPPCHHERERVRLAHARRRGQRIALGSVGAALLPVGTAVRVEHADRHAAVAELRQDAVPAALEAQPRALQEARRRSSGDRGSRPGGRPPRPRRRRRRRAPDRSAERRRGSSPRRRCRSRWASSGLTLATEAIGGDDLGRLAAIGIFRPGLRPRPRALGVERAHGVAHGVAPERAREAHPRSSSRTWWRRARRPSAGRRIELRRPTSPRARRVRASRCCPGCRARSRRTSAGASTGRGSSAGTRSPRGRRTSAKSSVRGSWLVRANSSAPR